jgi:7-cyano-7-deazaguanine synthase in queuosine biosynthesis
MIDCLKGILSNVPGNQIHAQYGSLDKDVTHYVLWSGGCDSTLLLYELLDTYGSNNVVAISYTYPWLVKEKYETERLHREAFKSKLSFEEISFQIFDIQKLILVIKHYLVIILMSNMVEIRN